MALTIDDLRRALDSSRTADWQAAQTPVSQYVADPESDLLGLNIVEEEQSQLAASARSMDWIISKLVPPPKSVDWRPNAVTPVKNQGTCGSCVAFAICAAMESRLMLNGHGVVDLAEGHLFFCGCGQCCKTGWRFIPALDFARQGIALESDHPYASRDCFATARLHARVNGYHAATDLSVRKRTIASAPVVGSFDVYEDFFFYRSGVYRHVTGELKGSHAVCIVGYDDSDGCWIGKNSWDADWGEAGFFRIAYGDCSIDAVTRPFFGVEVELG